MVILPFISPEATLETAGGKGANLARLTRAGFPVPRGFIISTDAYRAFVEAIVAATLSLRSKAFQQQAGALERLRADPSDSSGASPEVESQYARHMRNSTIHRRVRSSATAEDCLLSFAGQQDPTPFIGIDDY